MKIKRFNKKIKISLLLTLLISCFLFINMTAYAYTDKIGVVNESGARIRAQANTKSETLASVEGGVKVTICGEKVGEDGFTWYLVYVDGTKTGFIRGDLMKNTGENAGTTTPDDAVNGGNSTTTTTNPTNKPAPEPTKEPDQNAGGDITTGEEGTVPSSADCTLATFSISQGALSPEFEPNIFDYTITVKEDVTSIAVYGVPNDTNAVISKSEGFTDLELGNNIGTVVVTGSDGTIKNYTFKIIRGESSEVIDTPTEPDVKNPDDTTQKDVTDEKKETPKVEQDTEKSQKIIIIIMGMIIIFLIMIITFLAIKLRDAREYGWSNDDSQDSDETEETDTIRVKGHRIEEPFYQAKNQRNMDFDLDLEDELEDIRERQATDEIEQPKKTWKSVNFLKPKDGMEFEFLDVDDDDDE